MDQKFASVYEKAMLKQENVVLLGEFTVMDSKTEPDTQANQSTAKFSNWGMKIFLFAFVLPHLITLVALCSSFMGAALISFYFLIIVAYPSTMLSLIFGIIGIMKKEVPRSAAIKLVVLSILPVICGCLIAYNYLTMGEPW